jgi:hypothetical protein
MTVAFDASVRTRIGPLRVGPVLDVRMGNDEEYLAVAGGVTIGWKLPELHPRIDSDVSARFAVQRIGVTARHPMDPATAALVFWSPLPALQLDSAITLSPSVAALVGVRVDGVPHYDDTQEARYCDGMRCLPRFDETWELGGFAYGINVGVRLTIR